MFLNNKISDNIALMVFLITMIGINGSVEYSDLCTPLFGIFLGVLTGVFFGIIYYTLIHLSNPKLAFFAEIDSNNSQCSKPGKRQFQCKVKNKTPERTTTQPKYTMKEEEKGPPVCRDHEDSVWGFCEINNNPIPVLKWGVGDEGRQKAIVQCNHATNQGWYRDCEYIYNNIQTFR